MLLRISTVKPNKLTNSNSLVDLLRTYSSFFAVLKFSFGQIRITPPAKLQSTSSPDRGNLARF